MPKVKLSEIGTLSRGKSKHRPRNDKILYGGAYPFVQTSDIKNANHVLQTYEQTYNEIGLKQSKLWPKNTICITIAANIADSAILGFDACFPDSVLGLIVNEKIANYHYVEYLLQYYKRILQKQSNGTSQENINLETFEKVLFDIPPLLKQKAISETLCAIDKKIELNNKVNMELDSVAKDVYNYWFVQFDFPDEFRRPYKSSGGKMIYNEILKREIPEGWEVLFLEQRLSFERGFECGAEEYTENADVSDNFVKYYRVGDMDDSGNTFISKHLRDIKLLTPYDLVVSFDGSVGRISFGLCGAYSSGIRKIEDRQKIIDNGVLLFIMASEGIQQTIKKHATGSNILHASASISHLTIACNEDVLARYQSIIKPIYQQLLAIKLENKRLRELRDFLLPMLMNGQVSVSD